MCVLLWSSNNISWLGWIGSSLMRMTQRLFCVTRLWCSSLSALSCCLWNLCRGLGMCSRMASTFTEHSITWEWWPTCKTGNSSPITWSSSLWLNVFPFHRTVKYRGSGIWKLYLTVTMCRQVYRSMLHIEYAPNCLWNTKSISTSSPYWVFLSSNILLVKNVIR